MARPARSSGSKVGSIVRVSCCSAFDGCGWATAPEVACADKPYMDAEEERVWGCGRRGWRRREPLKSGVDADDIILVQLQVLDGQSRSRRVAVLVCVVNPQHRFSVIRVKNIVCVPDERFGCWRTPKLTIARRKDHTQMVMSQP